MNRRLITGIAPVAVVTSLLVGTTAVDSYRPALSQSPTQLPTPQSPAKVEQETKANTRKRIAVMQFKRGDVSSYYSSYRGGEGISELVINQLVEDGSFSVVDRSRLEQAMKDNNMYGTLSTADAVKLGQQMGVDAIIEGTVTRFDIDRERASGGLLGVSGSSETTKAFVQINARLISTGSGDILAVAQGKGSASESEGGGSVFGIGGRSSESNEDQLLTKATDKAIEQLLSEMVQKASNLE